MNNVSGRRKIYSRKGRNQLVGEKYCYWERVRMQPEGERGTDTNIVSERWKIHSRKGRNQLVGKKYCYWERVNIQPEVERGTVDI